MFCSRLKNNKGEMDMDKTENMIKYSKNKTIITQQKAIDAINEMKIFQYIQ